MLYCCAFDKPWLGMKCRSPKSFWNASTKTPQARRHIKQNILIEKYIYLYRVHKPERTGTGDLKENVMLLGKCSNWKLSLTVWLLNSCVCSSYKSVFMCCLVPKSQMMTCFHVKQHILWVHQAWKTSKQHNMMLQGPKTGLIWTLDCYDDNII